MTTKWQRLVELLGLKQPAFDTGQKELSRRLESLPTTGDCEQLSMLLLAMVRETGILAAVVMVRVSLWVLAAILLYGLFRLPRCQ